MRTSEKTHENLEKLLIEVYNRSKKPVITTELWKGTTKKSLFTEFKVAKNYGLNSFLKTGVLRIVKDLTAQKKLVIWDTRYPDLNLAIELHKNKNTSKKLSTPEVVTIEKQVETNFINIDEIIEKFFPEYLKYIPEKGTISRLEKMIKVLKHNGQNRYCDKEQIFSLSHTDETGEIVTDNYRGAQQYSNKRLVDLQILERNPKNKNEYRFIAEFDDLQEFIKRLAFTFNYLSNRKVHEDQRNARLALTEVSKKTNVRLLGNEINELLKFEEEKSLNVETQDTTVLTDLYGKMVAQTQRANDIHEKTNDLFEKLLAEGENQHGEILNNIRLLTEATTKLTEASLMLRRNNFISTINE